MAFDFKNAPRKNLKAEYARIARECGDDMFFTRKELKHLPKILSDGEQVLAFASGMMDKATWLIALTDRRILLLDKGMFVGLRQVSIDLDKVYSVSGQTGWFFGRILIATGGPEHHISYVPKKTVLPFTNRLREAVELRKNRWRPRIGSASHLATEDRISNLERLSALKHTGVLSDAEFEAQKAIILKA